MILQLSLPSKYESEDKDEGNAYHEDWENGTHRHVLADDGPSTTTAATRLRRNKVSTPSSSPTPPLSTYYAGRCANALFHEKRSSIEPERRAISTAVKKTLNRGE